MICEVGRKTEQWSTAAHGIFVCFSSSHFSHDLMYLRIQVVTEVCKEKMVGDIYSGVVGTLCSGKALYCKNQYIIVSFILCISPRNAEENVWDWVLMWTEGRWLIGSGNYSKDFEKNKNILKHKLRSKEEFKNNFMEIISLFHLPS